MNALEILIEERDRLNHAIAVLGGEPGTGPKRRGRPPGSKNAASDPLSDQHLKGKSNGTGRKPRTEAQRKAHSKRMKAYWAAKRAGQ